MSNKQVRRTIAGHVYSIQRRGTKGITIKFSHTSTGPKHSTHYVDELQLDFCDMKRMGAAFHTIMDDLSVDWHNTKAAISGIVR